MKIATACQATPLSLAKLRPASRRTRLERATTVLRPERLPPRRATTSTPQALPFDVAWAPSIDQASLAPQLFALSLFPYIGFLYFLTRSKKTPPTTLFGFYFLLVFVGVSIPAGIYAKTQYGTSLSNVDWLHGSAELFLTVTNLLIVLGLRQGIREAEASRRGDVADKTETNP